MRIVCQDSFPFGFIALQRPGPFAPTTTCATVAQVAQWRKTRTFEAVALRPLRHLCATRLSE
jgi:hypothetical protein